MLEVKNIKKTYHMKNTADVHALRGINLTFPDNGMVFILGRSGSGKSTLLHILSGLDFPDEGEIILNGKSSLGYKEYDWDNYRNVHIGFVFQDYNLLNELTVAENIDIALALQRKKKGKQQIADILHRVDMDDYQTRKATELSGGQKQRVAIARALVKNPDIIFADEPTGALDNATGDAILSLLKDLSKEKLVIVVSHDREFAYHYGDRIIQISDGLIISDKENDTHVPPPLY